MENIGQKKKPCEEKKIFAPKMASENAYKKTWLSLIIYKSRILKFKILQKVLTKKMRNVTFKCSKFSLYLQKRTLKNSQNLKLLDSLRKLRKVHVFCILKTLKVICRSFKENLGHLNV